MSVVQRPAVDSAGEVPIAALADTVARAAASELYAARLCGVAIRTPDDFLAIPLTMRADLQQAGVHGTRAVPPTDVCHYGESSGTSGAVNSVWLTPADLLRSARAIRAAHPESFAAGRIILNRFPFMAAPAHLMELIAQDGGGVAIPAGNINWDVPFPRALELARRTGAHVLAALPIEPVILGELAKRRGLDPARDLAVDTLFLGGAALPPSLQRRLARTWDARVIELYGSTETMLLGTSCGRGTLHLETDLAYCELLPAGAGPEARLVVTTIGLEGSPLVRFDTGDLVRPCPPCACGDARPGVVVLGREAEAVELDGRRLFPHDLAEAGSAAAEALDSAVFFVVVLDDRLLVRVETGPAPTDDPQRAAADRLLGVRVEVEPLPPGMLLDVDGLSRSPRVYKPIVVADWRRGGRRVLTVDEGLVEWPRPTWAEGRRWLGRTIKTAVRRRRLGRRALPPVRDR